MSANHEPTLAELKNNSERSRADLSVTVSKLRIKATDTAANLKERVSVPHIKQEIKAHLRESKENLVQSLKDRAVENPLQAIAVGAGLAYPVWSLLRRIPLPLVLVGGGFWLAHKSKQGSIEGQLTARATDQVADLASQAADFTARLQDSATEGANRVTQTASRLAEASMAKAASMMGDVANFANDTGKIASDMGQKLLDTATEATGATREVVSKTAAQTAAVGQTSKRALVDFVQRNPLLVAGSGLALGAFVAAAIPRSDVEKQLLGKGGDFIKNKASEAAADGVEHATRVATAMAGEVIASAAQQGLSGEGLTKAVERLTGGIKAVAKKGAQVALGEETVATGDSPLPEIR